MVLSVVAVPLWEITGLIVMVLKTRAVLWVTGWVVGFAEDAASLELASTEVVGCADDCGATIVVDSMVVVEPGNVLVIVE